MNSASVKCSVKHLQFTGLLAEKELPLELSLPEKTAPPAEVEEEERGT